MLLCIQTLSAAVLDFEGQADSTILTNQYPGLTFQNTIILSAGISLNEFEFPPHSGSNVASDNGGPVTIAFSGSATTFSGYFIYTQPITIQAFDSSNNLLGSVSSNPACISNEALSGTLGCPPNEPLAIGNLGPFASVTITGNPSGESFTLDDASFSQDNPYQTLYYLFFFYARNTPPHTDRLSLLARFRASLNWPDLTTAAALPPSRKRTYHV